MSEIWLPGLVVLVAGLVLGALLAVRLKGSGKPRPALDQSDLELQIRDLEERRDDLYRRLRAADEDQLGTPERAALEEAAAMTLMELDRLQQQLPEIPAAPTGPGAGPSPSDDSEVVADATPPPAGGTGRSMLVGVLIGASMMLIVGLLVYWAGRDAQPAGQQPMATRSATDSEEPHASSVEVPPELAAQIADLESRVAADPEDWLARKQLALSYVAAARFFEAFEEASRVLQRFPDDPDGLLVHGIVRLTMGQPQQAIELLDLVLAQHPDHRQALIYRGLALYQLGSIEMALDTWEMGVDMAGGSDPELEQLIAMAEAGELTTAAMGQPAAAADTGSVAPEGPVDSQAFNVRIDVAAGAVANPEATLFVYIMSAEGGPPVAARRISRPSFPVALSLGSDDSMMGAELPGSGLLIARLDADGNVATVAPDDLEAQRSASLGQVVELTLDR